MTQVGKRVAELHKGLAAMGDAARGMMALALRILRDGDQAAAAEALRADAGLNRLETELDHMCERRLILQEPYATDFRFIFSAIKTTRDLERIGDEVKVVARWGPRLGGPASGELVGMVEEAYQAVTAAVEALVALDVAAAERILAADEGIDQLESRILDRTSSIAEAFCAHALERIGDRATNIAENVIYAVRAQDVRHRKDG